MVVAPRFVLGLLSQHDASKVNPAIMIPQPKNKRRAELSQLI